MELLVEKWGNDAAVRLPEELLALLKAAPGDKLRITVQPGSVLLQDCRPVYSLDDLLTQCDRSSPEPADMSAWFALRAAGREWW